MSVIDQPAPATVPPTPRPDDSSGSLLSSSLFALGVLGILGLPGSSRLRSLRSSAITTAAAAVERT